MHKTIHFGLANALLQVVRGDFIMFFNQIFDALCKLSADSDPNVQRAAHLLDRLVKVNDFKSCFNKERHKNSLQAE